MSGDSESNQNSSTASAASTMRGRAEILASAGTNVTLDNLELEVLLDIRDLLQELADADSEPETVDVQVSAPKKGLMQKIKSEL